MRSSEYAGTRMGFTEDKEDDAGSPEKDPTWMEKVSTMPLADKFIIMFLVAAVIFFLVMTVSLMFAPSATERVASCVAADNAPQQCLCWVDSEGCEPILNPPG